MNERVLALGGGVGGVVAARTLQSELPHDRGGVLSERSRYHLFQPSLLWMLTGERDPAEIRRPVHRLEEAGHNLYSVQGVQAFAEALAGFGGGRIAVITAEPAPMGVTGPEVSGQVRGLREDRGIEYQPGRPGLCDDSGWGGCGLSSSVRWYMIFLGPLRESRET